MNNVCKIIFSVTLLLFSTNAFAWSATSLGGGNWAITCANGTSHSYSGSSAGLDTVGPALCPGGITAPGNQTLNELEASNNLKSAGYPPKGYPCLGCEPCPGNPTEFCSTTSNGVISAGAVVWSLKKYGEREQNFMINRYQLKKRMVRPMKKMQLR